LIYRRASLDELRHQAAQDGMRTMRQDGIEKILSGHSDYSQLIQVVGVAIG
jgi:type II secretory ATPase GspE/PulE/Tfp pilus assembly ATPase PilB-like protein